MNGKIRLKNQNIFTVLYIIGFIAAMYSGSTFLEKQVMPILCFLLVLLFFMAAVKGVPRGYAYVNRDQRKIQFLMVLIILFLFYQISYSYIPSVTVVFVKRFIIYTCFFLVVPSAKLNYDVIQAIRWYSFPVAISIIVTTILNNKKSGGLVGNYQFAGMMMSISFGVILINYYSSRKKSDTIGLILTFLAMLMSGKRTFTLISVIFYLFLGVINNNREKRKKFIKLTGLIIAAVVLSFLLFPEVRLLAERLQRYSGDVSYNGRIYFWRAAFDIFRTNPFGGIGMGCFSRYFDQYFHRLGNMESMDAHNVYIQLSAETGIIGLILFISLFVSALVSTIKLWKNSAVRSNQKLLYIVTYSLFIQCWFLFYCLTGNPLYGAGQFFFYVSGVAMMFSVKRYIKQAKKQKLHY